MRVVVRPDGRRFVREPGFAVHRREDVYLVHARKCDEPHRFLHLDDVDPGRLRLLDEELRQDVPGTDGARRVGGSVELVRTP